jgi:preprotein translocase subunit SecE
MVASKKQAADGAALAKKDPKGSKKATKVASRNRVAGAKDFFNGVKIELKKVHWPTRRETMVYTGVVLSTVTVVSILIWILDSALSGGLSLILG